MADHIANENIIIEGNVVAPGVPTQIAHPVKATARTVFAVLIAVASIVIGFGPQILEAILQEPNLPEGLRAGLTGIAVGIMAVAGIVTRIMAIPGVNEVLKKIKLGTGVETE